MEPPNYKEQPANHGPMCMTCKFLDGNQCTRYERAVKCAWYCDDWAWDGVVRVV